MSKHQYDELVLSADQSMTPLTSLPRTHEYLDDINSGIWYNMVAHDAIVELIAELAKARGTDTQTCG